MSNIYIQEPPALGKVLLKTSAGDIDIELWTKETPKACRNFIQLCMEGYYNGTIFHRVVPGFIVQGGDPSGDGTGGESIYGAPFKDEFHSRLRFNRRGLVAMANAGKDDNASQFFFTLAATPELQNKHTIFGKVTGDTIYNVLKLAEGLIGPDDRPEHPHRIISTEALINPFEDIVPRVRERVDEDKPDKPRKKKKEKQGVKNFGLLSFGEEAEEDEGEAQEFRGKPKSTHDLLEDPMLSKKTAAELELEKEKEEDESSVRTEEKKKETEATVSNIRDKLKKREKSPEEIADRDDDSKRKKESDSEEEYYLGKERDMERRKERDRIRQEIKLLRKEMKGTKPEESKEEKKEEKKEKNLEEDNEMYKQFVEEQERYKKMKEKLPKKGPARSRRSKLTRKPVKKKPWAKNLYENRDYPDNYTNSKFLEDLRKNLYVEKVTLKQAIKGSFYVVLRLCICVLYAILFMYMHNDWIHTHTVIYWSVAVASVCYFLYFYIEGGDLLVHFKIVLIYLVIGYILSPVLHTLTDTVSTDTIYAWSVIMMLVHLMFFDYNVPAAFVSKSLSINAAIFSSVCLVSRLSTPFDAFVLLTISVKLFVLSPQLFKSVSSSNLFIALFGVTLLVTFISLYTVSGVLLSYFVIFVLFLSGYCPVMFVRWQRYKDNIYGPWDEAILNNSDEFDDLP